MTNIHMALLMFYIINRNPPSESGGQDPGATHPEEKQTLAAEKKKRKRSARIPSLLRLDVRVVCRFGEIEKQPFEKNTLKKTGKLAL